MTIVINYSNKYILSVFCPTLRQLLATSSTLLLPGCSTFSIKYLFNIIENGFAVTEKLSYQDINEITDTAKLLTIEMRELYHDKTTPILVKTSSEPKKNMTAIEVSKKRINENSESVIDVMDSLMRLFDDDYKPEEDVNLFENFNMLLLRARRKNINEIKI